MARSRPQILTQYELHQIFNAGETGRFWQMLPHQTLDTRAVVCHGGKQGKARVSFIGCQYGWKHEAATTCDREVSNPEVHALLPQYSGDICLEQEVMDDAGYFPEMVEGVGFGPGYIELFRGHRTV